MRVHKAAIARRFAATGARWAAASLRPRPSVCLTSKAKMLSETSAWSWFWPGLEAAVSEVRNAPTRRDFAPPNGLRCAVRNGVRRDTPHPGSGTARWGAPHSKTHLPVAVPFRPQRRTVSSGHPLPGWRGPQVPGADARRDAASPHSGAHPMPARPLSGASSTYLSCCAAITYSPSRPPRRGAFGKFQIFRKNVKKSAV